MKRLSIQATDDTPRVTLDVELGLFEIVGNSYPENSAEFFKPVVEWMRDFTDIPLDKTMAFDFNFDYFNTSSAKFILEMLRLIEERHLKGHQSVVRWHYFVDDIDVLEAGEDYGGIVKVPFELVERDNTL